MKITDEIHQLKIDFEVELKPGVKISRFVHVLIIFGEKITLVDTGVKGSEKFIFEYIGQQGRKYTDIETIVLSHSHPDHIGSAARIKEITGCKILSHKYEQSWVEDIELQNRERPVPGFFKLVDTPVRVDAFLEDGQTLQIAKNMAAKCIHLPGHSKGMLGLFFPEDKILFTADAIPLKGDVPNYDHFIDLEKSLKKIKNMGTYKHLLTSWAPAINDSAGIFQLITEGELYLKRLDEVVKEHYNNTSIPTLKKCKACIQDLALPPFFVNPIVDKAFQSHFRKCEHEIIHRPNLP